MKLKCDYCGNYLDDTDEVCPHCSAPNQNLKRFSVDIPKTIEELKIWYKEQNLPSEGITRFFIGRDVREARAFGIYQDGKEYIVYKNKSNGERAIRYKGKDEAYAVNELYLKLKEEIINQKEHNNNSNNPSRIRYSSYHEYLDDIRNRTRLTDKELDELRESDYKKYCDVVNDEFIKFCRTKKELLKTTSKTRKKYIHKSDWKLIKKAVEFGDFWGTLKNFSKIDVEEKRSFVKRIDALMNSEDFVNDKEIEKKKQDRLDMIGVAFLLTIGILVFLSASIFGIYSSIKTPNKGYYNYNDNTYYYYNYNWYLYDKETDNWNKKVVPKELTDNYRNYTSSKSSYVSDFYSSNAYKEEKARIEQSQNSSSSSSSSNSRYDKSWDSSSRWDSSSSWDSSSTDWDSDW